MNILSLSISDKISQHIYYYMTYGFVIQRMTRDSQNNINFYGPPKRVYVLPKPCDMLLLSTTYAISTEYNKDTSQF